MNNLNLSPDMHRAISDLGFTAPSPIQEQSIPVLLEGKDLIGQAQTGTGKTAAFAIPVIERIQRSDKRLQAIVLCPTRELALQVAEQFKNLAKYSAGVAIVSLYGGEPIMRQIRALKRRPQIIIGTPGRVLDLCNRKVLNLGTIQTVVLDEADEMLNIGFRPDIEKILGHIPARYRQTILFSATMSQPILDLSVKHQKNAIHIKTATVELSPVKDQFYYETRTENKFAALLSLSRKLERKKALIFCNTKHKVDAITKKLKQHGFAVDGIHGGKTQSQRTRIIQEFRTPKLQLLVATDVAARGLDIHDLEAVINFDLPNQTECYMHRIGRTGRAGKQGQAYTLVAPFEQKKLREIRKFVKGNLSRQELPSQELPA